LPTKTVADLKALVVSAGPDCTGSTSTNCSYNASPYYDVKLENVVVVSEVHSDFDNKASSDGGYVAQRAFFIAHSLLSAENQGLEVIVPHYYDLPTLTVGQVITLTGSIRTYYGNTYLRILTIDADASGSGTPTPLAVSAQETANTLRGAEGADGGCNKDDPDTTDAEAYEGVLVDIILDGGSLISYVPDAGGGTVHRFSLDNQLMVSDNFGVLSSLQDGGGVLGAGQRVTRLRGFGYYSYGCRKIQPRSLEDLQVTNP
jgi:hypothetical protein